MAGKVNLLINNKCAFGVFIFILTYACLINGVNSQSVRNSGSINQNMKEPPDLDTESNNANIMPNLSVNKQREGKTFSNPNQIRFLCRNRLPGFANRRNIPAQRTRSPYKIIVPPKVTPGQIIKVEIQSNIRNAFRGYMLQVLSSDVVLGEFQASPSVNLQTCYSIADTATSAIRVKRNYATVFWKAPEDLQTNIVIRATVVKNYRTYWVDVLSEEIPVLEKHEKDEDPDQLKHDTQTNASNEATDDKGVVVVSNNTTDAELEDLKQAVSNTFESIDGPLESLDEVLLHQGIRDVAKVNLDGKGGKEVIHNTGVGVDDELTAPRPTPRYVYREMNMHPVEFEPPQTSEFLSTMLKMGSMLSGGGNRRPTPGAVAGGSSMGGLGSMMNMMQMLGGGGGGGGGLMSSLGTMSKLSGMLGGGGGGGGGMPGGLGALSSISGLLGGGGGGAAAPPAAGGGGGGGLGGLGALSSIGSLLGFGKKKENAPPPVGQPVNPAPQNGEPSLADLLGVDPNSVVASPTVIPSEVNPLGGVAAAKSGGLLSSIGGFAPMLAGIPIAMTLFGGKKKQQQQQPPWGQQGMQGQNGQFGQMGMQNGQFGQMPPGGPNGQFGQMGGINGQFGQMPGANGQFGQMPGANGQFGQMPGANGQFGQMPGANGQFGQMPGMNSQFGQTAGGFGQAAGGGLGTGMFGQTQSSSDTDRIIKLLEQQRMEIEALKTQLSGNSIVSKMGSFGNIPLSMGQTSSSLLGLSDSGSSLGNFGTTISPFSSLSATPSSSGNDALLKQLMQQNQMLLQQNQQFNNMVTNSMGTSQFGTSNPFSRVNRSNGQNTDTLNPSNNIPQNQNPILGQNQFNNAGGTMGQFQNAGQNTIGMNSNANANNMMNNFQNQNNNMMSNGGGTLGGQSNNLMNPGFNSVSGSQGMSGSSMIGNPPPAQSGGAGSLANMFGGTGGSSGGSSGGLMSGLLGGDGGGGGSPLAGLLGGGGGGGGDNPLAGLLGGGGSGGSSPLAGLLGGGGGGGPDLSGLMQNVDMNAMQSVLGGKEGQDLMNNMMGMLQGPDGGNLMKAVEGVMSGKSDPSEIQKLMSGVDIGSLQQMASQAEGMLSKSGIDPSALMGLMG